MTATAPDSGAPDAREGVDAARAKAVSAGLLEHAIEFAIRAPSSHNAQPWVFELAGPAVHVFADPTRSLPVSDPEGREMFISVGCVVHHLRVVLAQRGWAVETRYFPEAYDPDFIASITLLEPRAPTHDDESMAGAIALRHTNRGRFEAVVPSDASLALFEDAARADGAELLRLVQQDARERLVDLITEADRLQQADPLFRDELARWLNPSPSRRADGIVLEVPLGASLIPWVVRTFDRGDGEAAAHRELALGSPVLAVLATRGDHPRDWVRAGEALSRVLLVAARAGIAASFLNQPLEIAELRDEVRELLGEHRDPQLVLRMGHPTRERHASPRRGLDSVLRRREPAP